MDLSVTYLGMKLPHPFIVGSGPLSKDLDLVRRAEDAGAAAIVMHSLFEEQIVQSAQNSEWADARAPQPSAFFPKAAEFAQRPEKYLEQLRKIKEMVRVPVIASLNGATPAGWLKYSKLLEEAGANALELNLYYFPTDLNETGAQIEDRLLKSVELVLQSIKIPVAVKLSPFYSSIINIASQVDKLGASGLVLFNRIYRPEIDAEMQAVVPRLELSTPLELPLRLLIIGFLCGRVKASLAVTGGVHSAVDAIKAVMAGADVAQVTSALLGKGPEHLRQLLGDMNIWLEEHFCNSLGEMRGSLSLKNCADPGSYERSVYARILQSWRG
jgi:dihydroorotate dehydrogenase (fumarate)